MSVLVTGLCIITKGFAYGFFFFFFNVPKSSVVHYIKVRRRFVLWKVFFDHLCLFSFTALKLPRCHLSVT